MKRLFAGAVLAATIAVTPALAAPPAPISWTGYYINAGYGYGLWAGDTNTVNSATGNCALCAPMRQGGRGWLGTVGIGYDRQFGNVVGGIFTDFDFASIKGDLVDQDPVTSGNLTLSRAWSVGGRVGWLVTPAAMTFFNGGFSDARFRGGLAIHSNFNPAPNGTEYQSFSTPGWFIGGGVETSMMPGWFWRTEYRLAHYDQKDILACNATTGLCGSASVANSIRLDPWVQTVRSQIIYKFGGDGPTTSPFAALGGIGSMFAEAFAPPPAMSAWNGFYINGGGGYGMWAADGTTVDPTTGSCAECQTARQGGRGALGTVGAGYDRQVTAKVVLGVFSDFDFSSLKGTIQDGSPWAVASPRLNQAWAVGARAGWLVTPMVLSYLNAGYTQAHFTGEPAISNTNNFAPGTRSYESFQVNGFFVGGGEEIMFSPGWFWRNEYRLSTFSTRDIQACATATGICGPTGPGNSIRFADAHVQTFRTELLYKFNWGN